jgi:uncharacterized protein YigA (DUF484 family)
MTNANFEPRLNQVEIDMDDLKRTVAETSRNVSDLRSSISTLADIVSLHETQHEESRQRHEDFRERFDQFIQQAETDRAVMLRLIEAIAQGRNGNEGQPS